MTNRELEEFASTNEILIRLIYEFDIISLPKLIFLSFAIKNIGLFFNPSRQKYGLINEVFNAISIGLQHNFDGFKYIFGCLEILEKGGYVLIQNGKIKTLKEVNYCKENDIMNSKIFNSMIIDVTKLSNSSFIKGVIENV